MLTSFEHFTGSWVEKVLKSCCVCELANVRIFWSTHAQELCIRALDGAMVFVTNLAYLRGWLVVFNLLLAVYCLTIGVLMLQRPCFQVCEARAMSSREEIVLDFHFVATVAIVIGCGGLYVGHTRLIQMNRVVLVLFTLCYLAFGAWELLEVKEYPLIGALTLLVGVLVFVFGTAPSVHFGRLLRRQVAVVPEDNFHGVWSSSSSGSQRRLLPAARTHRAASTRRTLVAW